MTEHKETYLYCATTPLFFSQNTHDAIIQTLDRHLGYDENYYPVFFPHEIYEAALDTVNDAKIIFTSGIHPDYKLYDANPEQAVRDVGGRFAGYLTDARIDMTGHPTACATLALDPDNDIEQLIKEGKLSVSPSLGLTRDENGNIIKIKFQNLLIFPETVNGQAVPGDPGTKILNSKPNPNREGNPTNTQFTGKTMTEKPVIETVEKPIVDPALAAKINEMAVQFTAFQTKTAELEAQIKAKDDELKAEKEAMAQFTAKLEADKVAAKEREFQGMIHDPLFPPGLLKEENSEELLRAEFTTSPAQFTRRVLSVYATQNMFLAGAKEQGQQFSTQKKEESDVWTKGKPLFEKFDLTEEEIKKVI